MRTDQTGRNLLVVGGLLAFTLLGWTQLLVPALIREIERDFGVTDADMGTVFLLGAAAFTAGCLATGWAVPRLGRRAVLMAGIVMLVAGSVGALVPSWPVFLLTAVLRGFGSGVIEVGIQGMFLVGFPGRQGRAINMVHFCYSLGAALAPLAIAGMIGLGLPWPAVIAGTAIPWAIAGGMLAVAPMDGRVRLDAMHRAPRLNASTALVAAALAIGLYVAAESGIASWLVRFLAEAPLGLAASALTLFWASLAISRLVAARFGDLVAPERLATGGFLIAAAAIVGGVVVPSVELSIVLFGVAGFAFGPVYPGIILLGGRIHGPKDAITGVLASSGVAGAMVYPPLMGIISVGPGLGVAMGGAALLSVAGAGMVGVAVRAIGRQTRPVTADAAA